MGVAFLNLHRFLANDAVQEIGQGAFVVVQWTSPAQLIAIPSPTAFRIFERPPTEEGRLFFKWTIWIRAI
jgi:hypothetical protein